MPSSFLTSQQQQTYGSYAGEPSPEQLARHFHLDNTDHMLIGRRRADYTRLGFALQLCTVRFLGTFMTNPINLPEGTVAYIAKQLATTDWSDLPRYLSRPNTHRRHAREIKRFYGYRDFNDLHTQFQLTRWLYARAWLSNEGDTVLFELSKAWLIERKILLPGATTLARLIARVRVRVQR